MQQALHARPALGGSRGACWDTRHEGVEGCQGLDPPAEQEHDAEGMHTECSKPR